MIKVVDNFIGDLDFRQNNYFPLNIVYSILVPKSYNSILVLVIYSVTYYEKIV